jgi:signal transduction histidine kinase
MERARIALELHDGVIQTLASVEMRIHALCRSRTTADVTTVRELTQIQHQLTEESYNLRGMVRQLRSVDRESKTLLESAADIVREFRQESGISAVIVSESNDLSLPPALAHELLRIVREALTNIRKHSRARQAVVHFAKKNHGWNLVIEDDGRGFDFKGRLSHAELEATGKGPRVIRDRVRLLGGELAVVSTPGRGARLEISFSEKQAGTGISTTSL